MSSGCLNSINTNKSIIGEWKSVDPNEWVTDISFYKDNTFYFKDFLRSSYTGTYTKNDTNIIITYTYYTDVDVEYVYRFSNGKLILNNMTFERK